MSENDVAAGPQVRPVRNLLLLGLAFIAGFACSRCLRFTQPLPNELFGATLLAIPFLALRPLSQLPRVPRVIGRIVLAPVLVLSIVLALLFVACGDLQLRPSKEGCLEEVSRVDQKSYSVYALLDGCGGAAAGVTLVVEQRRPLLPGLYLFRVLDVFDGASEGNLTAIGPTEVRIHSPKGIDGSGWSQQIDHTYELKPHVYF